MGWTQFLCNSISTTLSPPYWTIFTTMTTGVRASHQRTEIKDAFRKAGLSRVDDSILSKCVGLASTLSISADRMAECWEAFSLTKNVSELTNHTFAAYKTQLIMDAEQNGSVFPTSTEEGNGLGGAVNKRVGLGKRQTSDGLNLVTPPTKRQANRIDTPGTASSVDSIARDGGSVSSTPQRPIAKPVMPKYVERSGVGEVVASFVSDNIAATDTSSSEESSRPPNKCVISSSFPTNVTKAYRHMFTTLQERAQALEEHLVDMGNAIIEKHGIREAGDDGADNGIAPLEAVNVPRQETVCCVGRICNEAHDGKLNSTSVVLEGSRNTCGGARVNVDLSHLKKDTSADYSLFPGQIVAIEGMNTTGRKLVANRICEGAAHSPNTSSIGQLRKFHYEQQDGSPVKLMIVSGPYTTSDNLKYEPFMDLLNDIIEADPDVVILTGPFVDMGNDIVKSGAMKLETEDGSDALVVPNEVFFANKIAYLIESYYQDHGHDHDGTQFVLIPSLDDATAQWVYPQAPFSDRLSRGKDVQVTGGDGIEVGTLGLKRIEEVVGKNRVHCLSNPCTLRVNEVVIGVTSTDVLFHISAEETNANLQRGSRLKRIAQHLVQQRSYYPLFPPHGNKPTNLDLNHMKQWRMPCQPDLLIIPSKLTSFASTVLDSTVVVNPGNLSRGTTGGTYAMMEIHPISRETLENGGGDDVQLPHRLNERVRVEIKRI